MNNEICTWEYDDRDDECGFYRTSCEKYFQFNDGNVREENGFLYCPYCGKPVEEINYSGNNELQ